MNQKLSTEGSSINFTTRNKGFVKYKPQISSNFKQSCEKNKDYAEFYEQNCNAYEIIYFNDNGKNSTQANGSNSNSQGNGSDQSSKDRKTNQKLNNQNTQHSQIKKIQQQINENYHNIELYNCNAQNHLNQESIEQQKGPKRNRSKERQTKNITKNFGKAILTNILRSKDKIQPILRAYNMDLEQFLQAVKKFKQQVQTIHGLRSLWLQQDNKYAKIMRILSSHFLRKHSYHYIFNSRVKNYSRNIKYRSKILQSVKNPSEFLSIKEY